MVGHETAGRGPAGRESRPRPNALQRRVQLETPEHVRLGYDLADLGSRFVAMMVDLLAIGLCLASTFLVGFLSLRVTGFSFAGSAAAAVFLIVWFALQWGYFLLFEAFWAGQTPGKRLLGLRVLHSGGQPLSFRGSVVRNLIRVLDVQPLFVGMVGGACMMMSRRTQRLGDLVADSIVVRDRGAAAVPWPDIPEAASRGRPILSDEQFALLSGFCERRDSLTPDTVGRLERSVMAALRPALEGHPQLGRVSDGALLAILRDEEEARRGGVLEGWQIQAAALVRKRRKAWITFRELVTLAQKRGLAVLPEAKLRAFGQLYRAMTADLARARTYRAPAALVYWLEKWTGAGHNVLYRAERRSSRSFRGWMSSGLPRTVRAHGRTTLLAALLLFAPMAMTYSVVRSDPAFARSILPAGMMTRAETTAPDEINAEYINMPGSVTPLFSADIMTNNLRVAFLVFAGGLLAGAGTAAVLVLNGVSIGAVFGVYANQEVLGVILAFVMPHGVMELTAICLAGAAGLHLGSALLIPGRMSRRAALAVRGREALSVLAGAVLLLVVAAIVEGFYSPSSLPAVAKFLFGGASAVVLVLYFGGAGRGSNTPTTAPAP